MPYRKIVTILIVVVAVIYFIQSSKSQVKDMPEASSIKLAGQQLSVEVANSNEEKTRGLSGRSYLDDMGGMLFVFDAPNQPSFWMKDMLIPIDIIWIKDNIVIDIDRNILPDDGKVIYQPIGSINYVLEVAADWTLRYNLKIGDRVEFSADVALQ